MGLVDVVGKLLGGDLCRIEGSSVVIGGVKSGGEGEGGGCWMGVRLVVW